MDAFGVVRRALALDAMVRAQVLQGGQFAAASDQQILDLLDAAQDEVDDQAVLFLYATFEARLREHIVAQSGLLTGATQPSAQFGQNLHGWFNDLCRDARMDKVLDLFVPSVNQVLIAQVGSIRKYRHWLAHGRRGLAVPSVTPLFAYRTLTSFLQLCNLT
jgi:hypothetical protein